LHEKKDVADGEKDTGHQFSKKAVAAIVAATIRKTAAHIAKQSKKAKESGHQKNDDGVDKDDYAAILAACLLAPARNTIKRTLRDKGSLVLSTKLHDVNSTCGIDTDAGMSINTMIEDFPCGLDESEEAKSCEAPSEINGGKSKVGGRGVMIIRTKSGKYLIDPEEILLMSGDDQPNFRVMSAQRLKAHGLRVVQCYNDTEVDVIEDRKTKEVIHLKDEGPKRKCILVVETVKISILPNKMQVEKIADEINKGNTTAMVRSLDLEMDQPALLATADAAMILNRLQSSANVWHQTPPAGRHVIDWWMTPLLDPK
jgi:hypothetical protein